MTHEEAQKVQQWCEANQLLQPEVLKISPGQFYLQWNAGLQEAQVHTSNYNAARHWCAFMQIEHAAGVPGYWQPTNEDVDRGTDGPLFE